MYYYAYVNNDDICTTIYALPDPISGSHYIEIPDNYEFLIGQRYNRTTQEFEVLYYYAVLDSRAVVTETVYYTEEQQTSDTLRSITFQQYQTVTGLYWNGTDYVTPPISVLAVASTDEINYKSENKWLSTHLDEMQDDIDNNTDDIATITTNLATVVTNLTTVSESLASLATTVAGKADAAHTHSIDDVSNLAGTISSIQTTLDGKANSLHTHTADSLSGVVKTINWNVPDASGNIIVTSGGMTALEILDSIKTVDGSDSGLDADKLDGLDSTAFAAANHTHTEYAATTHNHDSDYAALNHTHDGYLTDDDLADYATTAAVNTALASKADSTHNHDTAYSPINHTHTGYASSDHTHSEYAAANHTHDGYATVASVTSVETALSGKADSTHNHDTVYAGINHTHTGYAATDHTHSGYAAVDHTHSGYATSESVSAIENSLDNKANVNHTHSIDDVTGLSNALSGKADSSHTHTEYAAASHTHSNYAAVDHTHSGYASSSHNHSTLTGTVNITGAIKSNSVQVGYNSGSDTTLGSNSYPTIVAGTQVTLNGEKVYSPNIYPRNTGTFYLGAQSNRWSGIYSKVAVNVSSDERLKTNIVNADSEKLIRFINGLDVVNYRYLDDDEKTDRIGLIAQQVINADPEISKYFVEQGDDGYYSMRPADLVFPLIEAVKELYKIVSNK